MGGGYIQQQSASMYGSPLSHLHAGNPTVAPVFDGADYAGDDGWVNGNDAAAAANDGWGNPANAGDSW